MREVSEHDNEIDGLPVHWLSAPADGTPTLWVHGVPTSSADWRPFLAAAGGVALDLPGFGRSGKPASFHYSIAGYDAFIERFLELAGIERFNVAVHDWGGAALAPAARLAQRVGRVVIIDAVPLLPGYRWHRIARGWRTPLLGELMMGTLTPRVLRFISREANATPGPLPEAQLREVLAHFDHGTQRAILRLYRGADPAVLARAGERLGDLRGPALVVWGERDPYLPTRFAHDYAAALGGKAEVVLLPDAGHWPWLDRPDLVERVAAFVRG